MTIAISESIDTTSPTPSATCQYIYGIIPTNDAVLFDIAGVDDADDVYTVCNAGLAVVTSNVGEHDFHGMSREKALRRLTAHQRVVETVMCDYPVLPVKFGTILPDEAHIRAMLMQGAELFNRELQRVAGTLQIEVVVLWELAQVFAAIAQESTITELKARIINRPPEETMAERVALGQAVQAALTSRRATLRTYIVESLQDLALDMVINPSMDDSMVVNLALLIHEMQQQALNDRLRMLDESLNGEEAHAKSQSRKGDQEQKSGVMDAGDPTPDPRFLNSISYTIRCVGPLPPYSFASVEIQPFSFTAIDEARRLLELDTLVTESSIKRSYRYHAVQSHPDHNQDDTDAEERMAALARAYKLLCAYIGSQGSGLENGLYCLSRDVVEQTLLITISRQDDVT